MYTAMTDMLNSAPRKRIRAIWEEIGFQVKSEAFLYLLGQTQHPAVLSCLLDHFICQPIVLNLLFICVLSGFSGVANTLYIFGFV